MTSSMLAGERRWASSRRGGMTVLGKVAVPKPINLPSQKLENHGLDPNVEIVPKGSLSWGSRSSPSTSNPWGSSALSPNADGSAVSPHHPGGRPSSGGGLSRPSTAGSERHDSSATTWGPNSRPSSASGLLASNQSALTSSRPLSSETRPGSSHLSRFAEPAYENSGAWGPNGASDKLSISSKVNDFSLSSGDFPTLGSEKDNTSKSSEPHDHASYVRPGSSSGRTAPGKERNELGQAEHKSGTVDTWTRDGSPNFEDVVHPNADRWHGDPHQYFNSNVPPQHYDAWRGPPMNAPPGVWYRGPPPGGPPYPPVPHGGYPMEPFPYYRPQIPPPLPNSQSGPPPGPGPRGHHPRNGDFYRPQMPDAFIRPGMPIRPGFYPGPVPYDGYFGPPMGYNPNDRDMPFMGMPPGPPVYNMCQPPNPPELNDPHFRGGARGPGGNFYVSEKSDSNHSILPEESRGPYKVLRKRENEKDAETEDNWEQNIEKVDQLRPSLSKTDTRRNEGLIQNIEVSNEKARASDAQMDAEQSTELLTNTTIAFGSISITGDLSHHHDKSRQVRNQVDHHNRDNDRWQKKPPFSGSEISAPTENPEMVDSADGQAHRAKMREIAKQRAIERQREEEERIREQKAKARAKLEELNRRTLAPAEGTTQTAERTTTPVPEQVDIDGSQKPTEPAFDDGKQEPVCQISEKSQQEPVDQSLLVKQGVANATDVHRQKRVSHKQKPSVKMVEALTLGDKSTLTGTGEAMSSQEPTLANNSNVVTESTQQKKRTNKSSKNKHKLDDASASREVELLEPNPSELMVTDSKDTKQFNPEQVSSLPSNQHKPQHPRRTPRNPQANRFHVGDVAVWAPVRAHNKEEVTQDDVALAEKVVASTQTNPKSKRAEMERYVPKPVAKESEDMNVGSTVESKSGDNKQNKQVKSHGALKKSYHKSTSQHEELHPVSTEANVTHEWDPSDGWFMPDEYPTTAVVKDEGKEKRPAYKGQRSNVKTHKDISGVDPEVDQVDRPLSKENRSHWHPKPQYKGGWSGGSQTSNLEVRKEPVDGNQEGQRERKPSSFKTRAYSPNMEDEAQAQAQAQSQARQFDPQHHGFRKYGGQNDKPRHNQHNANANKDRQRQNLHYEYQPVGSNNNSKERSSGSGSGSGSGQGQSRRGGGNYYGRQ